MALITLRVIDGADRGRVYDNLPTPVTIGREEGNTIQLNDERISRFHVKIQEDQNKLVLTDLESTNGSKVNGEDIQLRILRHGDVIQVGRSLLLYGTREQIAGRLSALQDQGQGPAPTLSPEEIADRLESAVLDYDMNWSDDPELQSTLHMLSPPELPESLGPSQAAQLSELLEYLHARMRELIQTARFKPNAEKVTLDAKPWQDLLETQAQLAEYLRRIAEPGEPEE